MYYHIRLDKAENEGMSLPVIFGVTPNEDVIAHDLARMPHLLIGGQTGSGKSVLLHYLICSLVQLRSPEQVRFVLMDSKRVEFNRYLKLPHLYSPVVHESEQGIAMLKQIEAEMDRRLALFAEKGFCDIADFKMGEEGTILPRLIVVIDELADFIIGLDGAFEAAASRIAAIGGAVGIHLVMATCRPDAKVLSSGLRANIPWRIAFKVYQQNDSKMLLDEVGAEELLGCGDALVKSCNGAIVRLQTPCIRDEEIARIVDLASARYPGQQIEAGHTLAAAENEDRESMYARALDVVRTTQRASTSWLQRRLSIGYNDAAHLISLLEERGVIGPANANGPRDILI